MHRPRPIRPRLTIPALPLNLPLQRRIRHTHNRIPQIVKTVVIVYQLVLIDSRVPGPQLHSQPVDEHLHMEQAVHLMERGKDVSVFPAELFEFIKVHGWGQRVLFVVVDLEEAAAFGGELHPFGFGGVHGGLGLVVGVVARVVDEFLLVLPDCVGSACDPGLVAG